jgi:hypothetical protein
MGHSIVVGLWSCGRSKTTLANVFIKRAVDARDVEGTPLAERDHSAEDSSSQVSLAEHLSGARHRA